MATKIIDKLVVDGKGSDVVFDGLDFTASGYVEVKNAGSITIKNCRVYNLDLVDVKNYWLKIFGDIEVKLVIENCFFGSNPSANGRMVYNLIEPTAKLMNSSSISNNYFKKDCCFHNIINVYGMIDNSVININGNIIEQTAGGIRIGVKGNKTGTINIKNNEILETHPAYTNEDQGLVTIQPYNKETTSFAGLNIILSGNKMPSEQVIYGYYGANDTVLDASIAPNIILNGKKHELVIYH